MQLTSGLENKLQSGDKNVRKRALNHTRQDSQEAARVARNEVLDKCALLSFNLIVNRIGRGKVDMNNGTGTTYGIIPVSKPIGVVAGIPTNHRDKGVHYQS